MLTTIFSTKIYKKELDIPNFLHVRLVDSILYSEDKFLDTSDTANLITSYHKNTKLHHNPEFYEIATLLDNEARKYAKEIKFNLDTHDILLESMWFQIYKKNMAHVRHNHGNSLISCSFYVKAPKDCARISFWNPIHNALHQYPRITNALEDFVYDCQPETNTLIMFPSYLDHGTRLNTTTEPRIVISANWRWVQKRKSGE